MASRRVLMASEVGTFRGFMASVGAVMASVVGRMAASQPKRS